MKALVIILLLLPCVALGSSMGEKSRKRAAERVRTMTSFDNKGINQKKDAVSEANRKIEIDKIKTERARLASGTNPVPYAMAVAKSEREYNVQQDRKTKNINMSITVTNMTDYNMAGISGKATLYEDTLSSSGKVILITDFTVKSPMPSWAKTRITLPFTGANQRLLLKSEWSRWYTTIELDKVLWTNGKVTGNLPEPKKEQPKEPTEAQDKGKSNN